MDSDVIGLILIMFFSWITGFAMAMALTSGARNGS